MTRRRGLYYNTVLKMVLEILKGSESIEEATEKVGQLLKDREDN